MKKLISIVFIFISLISVYIHYQNNVSSEIQKLLYDDLYTGNYREESTARFNVLNLDYPNLSLSSLPMKGIVARYYYLGAQYEKALELLNESSNVNPYIMYNESVKQDIFYKLGVIDSALVYAEKAFTGIPNNNKHFIDLARSYVASDKYQKLDSIFKIVEKSSVTDIWKFYFSSLLTNEDKISEYGKKQAKIALEKFRSSPDDQLKLSAHYILFGIDKIQKSLEIEQQAQSMFLNENYFQAAKLYKEAYELNPIEYTFYENAALSNFRFGYYERAIPELTKVIDSLNPLTGKSEFILAQVYYNLKDYENACEFIRRSSKFNFENSFRLIGEYCKQNN